MPTKTPDYENLLDLARALSQQKDYEEILRLVARKATSLLHAEIALIMMVNPRTQQTVKTVMRAGVVDDDRKYRLAQEQVTGWLAKSGQQLLTADIKEDHRFGGVRFGDMPVKSVIAVSLRVEGIMIGSLILLNAAGGGTFTAGELEYLEQIAVIAAPYLRNVQMLQHYFEPLVPENALLEKYGGAGLLGKSEAFVRLLHTIEAATRCDVRVLLEGQSGTGKELVARAIHRFSVRGGKPFIAIDCGAIPSHLIESELFGHVKGAFTGAVVDRKGLLAEANHGTLFMDEIANLPMEMQAKFMRFLQEGEIRPVGANKTQQINVRIISASSRSLQKLVEGGTFREDLFYRLHVYPIQVPSLAERRSDIPLLANLFLARFAAAQAKKAGHFSAHLLEFLKQRPWSGNIRELENLVERLVALLPPQREVIDQKVLPPELKKELRRLQPVLDDAHVSRSLAERLSEFEAQIIRQALVEHDWNQSKAARALKIPVATIRYKMNKLRISRPA